VTHLRLVGVDPPAPRRRGVRSSAFSLTPDEVTHLRAAIRNLARSYPSRAAMARALGVNPLALGRSRRRLSQGLAVALWRLTGTPLDVLLRPQLAAVPSPAPATGGGAA
jgi:hypothetical protein